MLTTNLPWSQKSTYPYDKNEGCMSTTLCQIDENGSFHIHNLRPTTLCSSWKLPTSVYLSSSIRINDRNTNCYICTRNCTPDCKRSRPSTTLSYKINRAPVSHCIFESLHGSASTRWHPATRSSSRHNKTILTLLIFKTSWQQTNWTPLSLWNTDNSFATSSKIS